MKLTCDFEGVEIIHPERFYDVRGYFQREASGFDFTDMFLANNTASGTFRGLHYQKEPHAQKKLIRCTKGAIHDVIVDLRKDSKSYLKTFSTILSAENGFSLIVPPGFAHGYITLTYGTEVLYLIRGPRVVEAETGIRYNDPNISINLPEEPVFISEKDRNWPTYIP